MKRVAHLSLFALVPLLTGLAFAGDWPQFRGASSSGVSDDVGVATRWGPTENIRWKVALPGRGLSSPVVVGDRVYLTAASGLAQTRLHVLCFAADSGLKLWERQFWATGQTNCHPKTCMAAPTTVVGQGRVFALFATGDLFCLDADGSPLWMRTLQLDYPAMSNLVGRAASPVLHEDTLIVPMENHGASWLLGLDSQSGVNRWKVERPLENNYSTPLLVRRNGGIDLVVQAQGGLTGYVPSTGVKRWQFDDEGVSEMASPIAADGLLLGVGQKTVALRLSEAGPPEVVWRAPKLSCSTATPVVAGERIYAVKDNGSLMCADLKDGKEIWSMRIRGEYSGSPVVAGDCVYLVNESGATNVIRIGDKAERLATNDLADPTLATPAIARGCLFIRSDRNLYCIGNPK